ncbi:hypothetical protein MN116_008972 [Schistosoma mekongi]|uniref:GPI ethanolamine phosphate transferase 1 n=1 Tax=Schistosoma mekongi TaxID=38744 RepID=A0AAE1Z5L9_SCHME|nr:hypothetical protein MN116_008972 [Schistosoma mekongi]
MIVLKFSIVLADSWSLGPTIYQLVPLILVLSLSYSEARRKQLLTLVAYVWKGLFADSSTISSYFTVCSITFVSVCILESLVWGFFHRYLLSLGCLLFASWPYIDKSFRPREKIILSLWCVSCCCLAIFPLLPVIGSNMYPTIVFISGLILTPIGIITFRFVSNSQNHLCVAWLFFFLFRPIVNGTGGSLKKKYYS